jgi:hypothetical protein
VDPDSLNLDPDPDLAFEVNPDPMIQFRIRIRIQGFNDQKLRKTQLKFFFSSLDQKLQFTYPLALGLHTGSPSYRRSLQHPNREHPALQKMKFINCFTILLGHFCSFGSGTTLNPDPIQIRIQNTAQN